MSFTTIEEAFKILLLDKDFLTNIEIAMKHIMKDGKIDSSDIPDLLFIITTIYNNMKNFKLTENELPQLLKLLCKYIIEKYNLIEIAPCKMLELEKIMDSTIKLIMIKPVVLIGGTIGICGSLIKCICK
jgi:hypothetical protein